VGERDADEHALGLDLRDRHLADLERLARTEEDSGSCVGWHGSSSSARPDVFRPGRAYSRSPPSAKASGKARTASSVYLSSITHETAISDVEIIWMLIPSVDIARNIRAATPAWLRMPTPTMETLATRSSAVTPSAPISRASPARTFSARCRSVRGNVKEMSVSPSRLMFCTIMSTTMFCAPS